MASVGSKDEDNFNRQPDSRLYLFVNLARISRNLIEAACMLSSLLDKATKTPPQFPAIGAQRQFYGAVFAMVALHFLYLEAKSFTPFVLLSLVSALALPVYLGLSTLDSKAVSPWVERWGLCGLGVVSACLIAGTSHSGIPWDSAVCFAVIVACYLTRPFGLRGGLLFSVPLMVAYLFSCAGQADLAALITFVALNFLLVLLPRESVSVPPVKGDQLSGSELINRLEAEKQQLTLRLDQKERDFEREIEEQTRYLRDANTQLSQQIGLRKTISDALVKSQTRLTQAIDASHLGLIDWDVKAGQFYQSAFHKFFGDKEQRSEQVIETLKQVIHPDDYSKVRDTLNACLRGDKMAYDLQYRVKDDADWLWIEECGKVVDQATDGRADRILGTRRNIHSEILRDEQVRLAKSVFDYTSEGVFVLDQSGVFQSANPAYAEIIGLKTDQLVGRRITELSDTPSREEAYAKIFDDVRSHGYWQGELLEKRVHGDYFPQWTQVNAITDDAGQLRYFAGMVADISDRKAADEKLAYLLNYDDLTKLANRVQFQDQLHRALVRYKDEQRPFALVLLDIDRFKQFNDSFGHEASDQLLIAIADRLSANVQKVDILARVGGNEFACIVECSETFSLDKFAQRLFNVVTHEPYEIANNQVVLSCSVGLAQVPGDTQDIETLMRFGALAVQKAKYHGGNQILPFDDSLKSFSRHRLEMEHELRKALSNDELEVFYQPKLDLNLGKITSYEALIRWVHPTRGIISPEEFVNIAEENGLINDLGAFVLNRACEQTQQWRAMGFGPLQVSVNLSARQLKESGFRAMVASTIRNSGLAAESLELELTESMIMADTESMLALLNDLREQGIKLSVDDFGTGYSSLSYLKELPVDTLKIDRAFVDGMEHSSQQEAIVKAIVVLGTSLSMRVVAEGVENDQQLDMLRELGCHLIQGYHISKPLKAEEMQRLLERQQNQVA